MKDLYTKAAAVAVPLIRGVGDDQLTGATPCAEFTVRDLVNHLFQVVVEFQKAARFEDMDFTTTPDYVHGEWRERFTAKLSSLTNEWSQPGALEGGSSQMGFPREMVARMPVFDLTVHSWDLARATGQPFAADSKLVDDMFAMAPQFVDRGRQAGQFGKPVGVPANAPTIERLVGLVGRDPAWKP